MTQMLKYIILILLLPILFSCNRNPLKINVSGIKLTLLTGRLDQDLFRVTPENADQIIPELQKKYDLFFGVYNKEVLAIGESHDSLYAGYLLTFLSDPTVLKAKHRSDSLFANFEPYFKLLEEAFKHFNYYYPGLPVPVVITYLSGYNQSIVTTPEVLGISLDNYLGSDCPYYRMLGLPAYKRENMEPRKMIYDAMFGWISQQLEYRGKVKI